VQETRRGAVWLVGWKVLAALLTAAGIGVTAVIGSPLPARSPHRVVQPGRGPLSRALIGSGSATAEAERVRSATSQLADEMTDATRCHPRGLRYEPCVLPALRHAVMGGRLAGFVLHTVIAAVPPGRCRERLVELQAANVAAGDMAHWTLSNLYDRSRGARRHEAAAQIARIAAMLTRSSGAMAGACSPDDGPAA